MHREFRRRLETYWFTKPRQEQQALLVVVILFALLASFNQWGDETFSFRIGLYNFLWSIVSVGGSFLLVDAFRRIYSIKRGLQYELQLSWHFIGIGTLLTIATGGAVKLFIGPTFYLKDIPGYIIGKFPRRVDPKDFARVGLVGIFLHFILADLAAMGHFWFLPAQAQHNMVVFNLVYAALALIPMPPLDGSKVIYHMFSHEGYMYTLPSILIGTFLGYLGGWFLGWSVGWKYLSALFGAIIVWTYWESFFPKPPKMK